MSKTCEKEFSRDGFDIFAVVLIRLLSPPAPHHPKQLEGVHRLSPVVPRLVRWFRVAHCDPESRTVSPLGDRDHSFFPFGFRDPRCHFEDLAGHLVFFS
jgi:hypothetical protein